VTEPKPAYFTETTQSSSNGVPLVLAGTYVLGAADPGPAPQPGGEVTLSRRYLLELRRSCLGLVDALEHALGYRPTTRDLRQRQQCREGNGDGQVE
jgi:hypothetical protein